MRRRQKKRDYEREYDSYHGTAKQKKRRAQRNAARAKLTKSGAVRKNDGKVFAIVGMLEDKDLTGTFSEINNQIDQYNFISLVNCRYHDE